MSESCVLTEKNGRLDYCAKHDMEHWGHNRAYALGTDEKSIRMREAWDKIKAGDVPPHHDKPLPNMAARTINYIASLTEHIANGRRLIPLEVRNERWAFCEPCEFRNREFNACSICGCPLSEDNKLGDKLSWAVSKCPDGKWASWQEPQRHLLYHIWPRKLSAGTWQRNLDQLKQRWNLFNGKLVIAVATSTDSHDFEAVQAYMQGYDCEWVHVENDPNLREVKTFMPLFERVAGLPGYTFYAQGKGVTKPVNPGVSIHPWATAMYEVLLDHWPLVEKTLKTHPVVGCFKKSVPGAFNGSRSQWHYSGSFCWLRNDELWRRDWRAIEQVWYGIESWPSMIYSDAEAGCLFFHRVNQFDLYSVDYWGSVERNLTAWKQENAAYRTDTGSLTTISSH